MAWKQGRAFRALIFVAALGVVLLVATILVLPTYKKYIVPWGHFAKVPPDTTVPRSS